jgi:hypothetical protein
MKWRSNHSRGPPTSLPSSAHLLLGNTDAPQKLGQQVGKANEALAIAEDLTNSQVVFSENGGLSMEDSIIITNAKGDAEGVDAEYYYLEKKLGKKGVDWNLISQSLVAGEAGRSYDKMDIRLSTGKMITMYFDITDFYGKWLF